MVWEPNPARDAAGNVVPHDDPETVPGEWTLLRHIHPEQWTRDGRTGAPRPQSIAFAFSTEGSRSMSVDVEPPMRVEGLTPTHYAKASLALRQRRRTSWTFALVLSRSGATHIMVGSGHQIPRSPETSW